jgi:hypothetical protein
LEGPAVSDGVLEVSAVPKGVAHVLMVRALGVEDVVQCVRLHEVLPRRERQVVRQRALLREASSPSVCRVAGLYRVVVLLVQASLLR